MRVSGWFRQVFHDVGEGVALRTGPTARIALAVVMLTATPVLADLTASYDGSLLLPKQGEEALVASGLVVTGCADD